MQFVRYERKITVNQRCEEVKTVLFGEASARESAPESNSFADEYRKD